jgi:hypothetical protein
VAYFILTNIVVNMFWNTVMLLAIVFVLSYDPKSRTLEKIIESPARPTDRESQQVYFQKLQFGELKN